MKIGRSFSVASLVVTLLALTAFAAPAFAQLQGGTVYPINGTENAPTSFATITSAVAYMATNGVAGTGQVILELQSGYAGTEAAPLTIGAIPGVGATLGITFRPGPGYTATTVVAGVSGSEWALRLTGSYLTLDGQSGGGGGGRNWTIRCTGTGTSGYGRSAVRLGQATPTAAQTDVTVKYCVLEGEAASTTSAILGVDGAGTYTFKNVLVANNLIRSTGVTGTTCRGYGITMANLSGTLGNTGWVVRDNVIDKFYARGINLTGAFPGALIYNNEIYHSAAVTQPSATEFSGIYFSTTTAAGTKIYKNFLHDFQFATTGPATIEGIYLYNLHTSGARLQMYDNRVVLGSAWSAVIYGFRDYSAANGLADFDYNSIYIGGTVTSGSNLSACFRKEVASLLNIRDNIFYNARSNSGASGAHYAISLNAVTGLVTLNNNDYYTSGTGGILGYLGSTQYTTLAAWKAAVGGAYDTNSISQNPYYVNPTGTPPDLHLNASTPTRLESGGVAIAGIDDDFEGDVRYGSTGYGGTGTAPDIGADEGNFTGLLGNDVAASAFIEPVNGGQKMTGAAFSPQASFENLGANNQSNVPVRFRILDPSSAEVYNNTAIIATLNAGAGPQTVTFSPTFTATTEGTYTMYARSELVGDQNAGNDQIVGTFAAFAPLSGNYNIGAAQAAPWNTLTNAIARLNGVGVAGPVTFALVDASYGASETFPLTINQFAGGSTTNTVTIKPAAGRPAVAISGSSATAIFVLNGADYVILDGASSGSSRDLTITNTSTAASTAVVWLKSLAAGQGCVYDQVRNCVLLAGVDQSTSTSSTYGILAAGTTISTTGGADNDNDQFVNNEVRKVRYGIYVAGVSGNPNDNNVVSQNLVGPAAWGSDEIGVAGIGVTYQNAATVSLNEVRFVGNLYSQTGPTGGDHIGIGFGDIAWTPVGTTLTNSFLTRNVVHDVVEERTYSAVGIVVASTAVPSSNVIANNMIYGVRANGTSGDQCVGLGIYNGSGDKVVFNSISLSGDLDPGSTTTCSVSAAGLRIASTSAANLTLKDNVIAVDYTGNTTTLKHYAIIAPATTFAWGTGASDNNDYYPNPTNTQMVLGGIGTSSPYTDVPTLAGWRTTFTPNQDAASVQSNPPFVSGTNLHLVAGSPTPLESGGAPFTGVVDNDYDNDVRWGSPGYAGAGTAPDIGADEGNFTPLSANDVAALAFIDPISGSAKIVGTAFQPTASFQNLGTSNETNVPVRFRIVDAGSVEIYNDLQAIASMPAGGGPVSQAFASVSPAAGTYTMYARAELPGDVNPANDQIVGTFEMVGPLAGNYNIGAAQPAPFNTLTGAIGRLNQVGISASVTFTLVDALYGPAETFPLTINPYPGTNPAFTVTIKPANPGTAITGASATAVFVLNGADYVVIDGSSTTSSRDLTITNTSTAGSTAVVWLKSGTAVDTGCIYDVVKNCVLLAGADQSTGTAVTFGVIASDGAITTTSYGYDNNHDTIDNNEVRKAQYGIYFVGISGNPGEANAITRNVVGPTAWGAEQLGKAGIVVTYQNAATISRNEVRFVGALATQTGPTGTDRIGIGFGDPGWTPSGTTLTNSSCTRNLVHDVVEERTYSAVGIVVASTASPSNNVVANNMIYGVLADGTSGDQCVGLGIYNGSGDVVAFNSLWLAGDLDPGTSSSASYSAVGIRIASTAAANLTLKNNVVKVDYASNTATLKHYAIVAPASYAWGTGGSDNNDYYAVPSNPQMVLGGIGTTSPYTDVPTLAGWRTQFTPNQDAASIVSNPPFTSGADLHIPNGTQTELESSGAALLAVTDDYDGEPRLTPPDMGADEFLGIPADLTPPAIAYAPLGNSSGTTTRALTGVVVTDASGVNGNPSLRPRVYYKKATNANAWVDNTSASDGWKYAEAAGATSPFDFTIDYALVFGGVAASDVIQYFVVAEDLAGTPNVGINSGTFAAAPASVNLQAAQFPIGGTINSYTIVGAPLSGDYTVGTSLFTRATGVSLTFERRVTTATREVLEPADPGDKSASDAFVRDQVPWKKVLREVEEVTWVPMANGREFQGELFVDRSGNPDLPPEMGRGVYATLTAAVADLNLRGLNGPVRLLLTDATYPSETFPVTVNVSNEYLPTATNTVTIKPSTGVTASVSGAASGTAILKIFNTNYVTIDGSNSDGGTTRDLTLENTGTTGPSVVWFGSNGTTPITNGMLKNCVVRNGVNTSSAVVISDGTTSGTAGYFSAMEIRNNKIEKAYMGVYANGGTTLSNGSGLTYARNEINTSGTNAVAYCGLYMQGVNGGLVANNDVGNFDAAGSQNDIGIWLATGATNVTVDANRVHDLGYTGTSGYGAKGIAMSTGLAAANVRVSNNMVSHIYGDGDSYSSYGCTYSPVGLYAYGSTVQGGLSIYDNSVFLYGNTINYSAYAYSVGIGLDDNSAADVSGNCVVNDLGRLSSTGAGAVALALEIGASQLTGGDHNDLYANSTGGGLNLVGKIAATDYAALPAWRAASGRDANSISADPLFVGPADLHVSTTGATSPVANAGMVLAGVTADYDGNLRTATPDIGADEFTTFLLITTVDGAGSIVRTPNYPSYNPGAQVGLAAVPDTMSSFIEWTGDATGSNNPIALTMDGDKSVTAHFDNRPLVSISDATVVEGNRSVAAFAVTLSWAATDTVRVDYATADSTAIAGEDYVAAAGRLVFNPGVVVDTLRITVLPDNLDEETEYFKVLLSNATNGRMGDPLGIGTIEDDDAPSAVPDPIPAVTFLGRTSPNPISRGGVISYGLHRNSVVHLRIFDVQGRMVRNLVDGPETAGYKRVVWDGTDESGGQAGAGLYLMRMEADQKVLKQRLIVVR